MTRPTDCTTSTTELRGLRNITASSAGTSTPSDRQRALDRIRQTFSPALSGLLSQSSSALRRSALNVPSTWWATQRRRASCVARARRAATVTSSNSAAIRLESLIVRENATARRIGSPSTTTGVAGALATRQAVPAADDLHGVVEVELGVLVGQLAAGTSWRRTPRRRPGRAPCSRSAALARRPRRSRAGETRAVELLVVHRASTASPSSALRLGRVVEQARRGGHVQPPLRGDVLGVVDAHEVRLVLAGQRRAGGAVRLVADDQVELRQAPSSGPR